FLQKRLSLDRSEAMADEKRRKSFQQEVTCPICLCYYTSPVVLDCGHCFCRMCIVRCWEEPGRDSRCPECRSTVKTLKCITWQQLDYDSCSLLFVPPPHKKTPIAKVTLDPETAHPQLILSADGLSVTCGDMREEVPDNPKRFNQLTVVLGREAFTEGRYSWEVTVGNEEEWALGVARKSVRRKGMFNFTPQEGVWAMGKWRGQYRALSDNPYHLHPSGELRRIRVTLNYTGQRVAFFDVDRGIALLAFAGGSFSGEDLLPFFWYKMTLSPNMDSFSPWVSLFGGGVVIELL
uniref:Uncharacterized protein n=1 Tax=Podarcis muralis TaxID=64176 RepID=A0A670HYH7_PODMU